jgi:hypothetical protein
MSYPSLPEFKRGDTFSLTCTYKTDGVPTSITGYTIRSQIRQTNKTLVAILTATLANQSTSPGVFTLTPDTNTEDWPVETLVCDIEITENGAIRSTNTFAVPIVRDITLPAGS